MWHLHQDARAVTGVNLATTGAAVIEVQENLDGLLDDRMGLAALDVGHETDATGVMFKLRIVKSLGARGAGQDFPNTGLLRIASAHQLSSRCHQVEIKCSKLNLEIFCRVGQGLQ